MATRSRGALVRSVRDTGLPVEFIGYGLVSALALAVDWALLVICTEFAGLHYSVSATIGFFAGLAIAYGLSVAFVFRERAVADRRFEFIVFALVGVCGLGLTQILMRTIVETTGIGYAAAKAPTAGMVFLFNFAARRALLFSRWSPCADPVPERKGGGTVG